MVTKIIDFAMLPAFSHPWWLLLFPPLVYLLWLLQKNSFAEGSKGRRRFWLGVRALILLLLVGALAGFQTRHAVPRGQTLFLLDASNSVDPDERERALQLINDSMEKIHRPDQAGIIVFGADAVVERFPGPPRPLQAIESRIDGTGTNLKNAIELAVAGSAADYPRNFVLLTDGSENPEQAAPLIHQLREKGDTFEAFYLQPLHRPEAKIETLRVPADIHLKQAFQLEIVTSSNTKMPALLRIFRNGSLIQEETVELDKEGKGLFRLPQTLELPGVYRYQAELNPKQDYGLENNRQEVWVSVQGPPRVLLADEKPEDLRYLETALNERGFQTEVISAHGIPMSLQEMLTYQAIFLRNVSASVIHDQMPLLKQYVHDFGGGLAMLGGEHSFGPGGYYQTPVEDALPVRMDLINKKYLADVAVAIVIDKSGSMSYAEKGRQKIDMADEGAARLAQLLKKSDQLGVLAVDSVPKWAVPIRNLNDPSAAVDAITSIRAGGGGIYVYSGLAEAYRALKEVDAPVKHVILFADTADCEEKDGPSGMSSQLLAQQALRDEKITTTTIGIGQTGDSDVEFLTQVATIGEGRFYFTHDMFTLPEIFAQESMLVQRYYINEERFTPKQAESSDMLAGIQPFPDLLGYVATSAKPSARVSLLSHHNDPVLATWQYGIGHAAAFASDPTDRWGALWLKWPDYQRFWSQLTRSLTGQTHPPNFRVSYARNRLSTIILVDAMDEKGAFLDGLSFQGVLVNPAGTTLNFPLAQSAPGRYEATVSADGNLFGKIFLMGENGIQEEQVLQIPVPEDLETKLNPMSRRHLELLVDRVIDAPADLRFPSRTAYEVQPFLMQMLLLSAFLFLLDVVARKIDFRSLRNIPERTKAAVAPAAATVSTLKQVKAKRHAAAESFVAPVVEMQPQTEGSTKGDGRREKGEEPATDSSEYMERLKKAKRRMRDEG